MGAKQKLPGDPLRIKIGGIPSKRQPRNRVTTTKYNWLTFLPINFYDQFRRAVYFYFLIITIISFFVNDTISPLVSLLPLLFVMVLTALKEGLEDLSRARSDKMFNSAKVTVIRNGNEQVISSEFIMPGDLVIVTSDNDVPCDLVLLQSSGLENKCFVITANLDGETNVKTIFAPANYELFSGNPSRKETIVCEKSSPDLYSFNGRIEMDPCSEAGNVNDNGVLPLTIDNLLLRGVRVQGTDRVIGCAIYTGMHTKLQLNSRYTGNKSASSERYINKFMVVLIVGMILVVLVLYLIQRNKESKIVPAMPHLGPPTDFNSAWQIFEDFLSFLLLFNYMVPISAYMNIEVYRVFGSYFMHHDLHLYDEKSDQPCEVNSSNLNEELGQVNILFSDKTGTLTKNLMKFVKCYVSERSFHLEGAKLLLPETGEHLDLTSFGDLEHTFFKALTVCHTVEVHKGLGVNSSVSEQSLLMNDGIVEKYQASSPDEKALLEGCARLGISFVGQKRNFLYINNSWGVKEELRFERLHVLEFSSERKRMSIIVRDEAGTIWLYSKGAENVIFPRCNPSLQLDQTNDQVTKYAKEGLRTLAVARRTLTEEDFSKFEAQYKHANTQLSNRKDLISKCYETVEVGMDLLGCTALEDALQDDVNETLEALQRAGLKIWVLTGDKIETAVNISLACHHIPQGARPHFIIQQTKKKELLSRLREIETTDPEVLVIDGTTIAALLKHLPQQFSDLALRCRAVLCCRLSPLQKSEIVSLIKRRKKHITAAIGDGANDISMIQEAHIGIGIAGREGKQAARCADFSVVRFEMLRRLLLVHGHYNSQRLALMVLFYCYKNIIITGCMALFQVYDLFSATNVYNSLYLWLFDIVYISFSFTYLALTDKNYNEETLLRHPELYQKLAHNKHASMGVFGLWMLNGFVHCFIIFYFAYAVLNNENVVHTVGQTASFQTFGTMLITIIVIVGNLKLLLIARYMTYINIVLIFVSIAAYMITTFLYNLYKGGELFDVYNQFLASLPLWLYTIICSVACLLPDLAVKIMRDLRRQTNTGDETKSDNKIHKPVEEKV
ncbi:phospholipid-transporting ATPase IF isoform X1 [Drosophila bipectinata]|uniref:phospholipid-transporting ATPase IF isoform X1 n=2 Tax=Drosophila bipectinata TaxID=42026 RepID=UPI001C892707|nr:phospholipid-transporting ATPase IF isoform X1 [Drosophila bipectinata]